MEEKKTIFVTVEQTIRNSYPVSVTEKELYEIKSGNSDILDGLFMNLATDKWANIEDNYWIDEE